MSHRAAWALLAGWLCAGCAGGRAQMAVNVPVADLRALPHTTAKPETHDSVQETQLLYGEGVRIHKRQAGWALVESIDQPEFTHHNRWEGYPGWIRSHMLARRPAAWTPNIVVTEKWASTWSDQFQLELSPWRFALGTRLRARDMGGSLWKVELLDGSVVWMPLQHARSLKEARAMPLQQKRHAIIRSAELLMGDAYFWGGRSPVFDGASEQPTGVDCSALTNLAYLTVGVDIPRDAHEQFLRATKISALQPGDLVFLSERDNPHHVVHVMLYAGEEALIEGPGTGFSVRRISFQDRLGRPRNELSSDSVIDGQTVRFGTYLQ